MYHRMSGKFSKCPGRQVETELLQNTVERVVDVPVAEMVKQLVKLPKTISEDEIQERIVEQTIETLAIFLVGKIFEVPSIQTQGKTQQGVNMHVQHVVDTVEVEKFIIEEKINQMTKHIDAPPLQFTEKVVDILVVAQRQIHADRNVQKTIQIPQLQHTDQVVDVPVVVSHRFHRCTS